MSDTRPGDRAAFFLLGAAIGTATALLMAPASGAHTRRRLRRQGEEIADYLIDAGKELVDKCEDLYERSGEVVEDATHELSGKYRALHEYSRQLLDEAETILRRTKRAALGR
jgi:gas vesicle protein